MHVQGQPRVGREGDKELLGKCGVETPDELDRQVDLVDQASSAGDIDGRKHARLVHGDGRGAETSDTCLVAKRLGNSLAEHDANIFDRVMGIDLKIPARLHDQVERPVPTKRVEHVIEERHACDDIGRTRTVQIEPQRDVRLVGRASLFSYARHLSTPTPLPIPGAAEHHCP